MIYRVQSSYKAIKLWYRTPNDVHPSAPKTAVKQNGGIYIYMAIVRECRLQSKCPCLSFSPYKCLLPPQWLQMQKQDMALGEEGSFWCMAPCLLGSGPGGGSSNLERSTLGPWIYKFPAILDSEIRLDFVGLRGCGVAYRGSAGGLRVVCDVLQKKSLWVQQKKRGELM